MEDVVVLDSDGSAMEEIVLDSDDDEPQRPSAGSATATMSVVTSRPLDLSSLGLMPTLQPHNIQGRRNNRNNAMDMTMPRIVQNTIPPANRHITPRVNLSLSNFRRIQPPPSSVVPKLSMAHLSLMHTYNLKRRQLVTQHERAVMEKRPRHDDEPRENHFPGYRHSPPVRASSTIEVDWRKTMEKLPLRVAPIDKKVSDDRLKSYHFDAIGPKGFNEFNKRDSMPWMRFKCTFGGCRKIVNGDYHFVVHLWTHIVTFKQCPDDSVCEEANALSDYNDRKVNCYTDVDKLARCPECLTRFHYPIQMQIHYTRAHSKCPQAMQNSTCTICEKDVTGGKEGLRKHLLIHSQMDAPYNCRVCKFRTTLRSQMFKHYIDAHGNTGTLMCPFCMYTHVVPSGKLERALFVVRPFVEHMKAHCDNKRLNCEMCACSFVDAISLRRHKLDHMQIPDDWTIVRDKPKSVDLRSILTKTKEACAECGIMPSCLLKRVEKCSTCEEKVFWKAIREREASLVGKPNFAEDTVDGPIPAPLGSRFICRCGLSTVDKNKFMYHFQRTKHFFKIIEVKDKPNDPPVPAELDEDSEDMKQALMFATTFKQDSVAECRDAAMRNKYFIEQTQVSAVTKAMRALEANGTKPEHAYKAYSFTRAVELMDDLVYTGLFDEVGFVNNGDDLATECAKLQNRANESDQGETDADETESDEVDDEEDDEEQEEEEASEMGDEGDEDDEMNGENGFLGGESSNDEEMEEFDHNYDDSSADSVFAQESAEDDNEDEEEAENDAPEDGDLFGVPPSCLTPESAEELDSQGSSPV